MKATKPTPISELRARGFKNPRKTLKTVRQGLAESAQGNVIDGDYIRSIAWAKTNLRKLVDECREKGLWSLAGSLETIEVNL